MDEVIDRTDSGAVGYSTITRLIPRNTTWLLNRESRTRTELARARTELAAIN